MTAMVAFRDAFKMQHDSTGEEVRDEALKRVEAFYGRKVPTDLITIRAHRVEGLEGVMDPYTSVGVSVIETQVD